jgi:hypothetical protein
MSPSGGEKSTSGLASVSAKHYKDPTKRLSLVQKNFSFGVKQ